MQDDYGCETVDTAGLDNVELDRITRMVENDGDGAVKNTLRVAQSDVVTLLGEYMDIEKLNMYVEREGNGYRLKIDAEVGRIYEVGKLSADGL